MSDETNELLRQILDSHRQFVALYQRETERSTDFRIAATEMQKAAARRQITIALVLGIALTCAIFIGFTSMKRS